ncbi:MAG: non-canonical purine NTP pyrophosphatase [Anaerolineae bacterium]|nr:non-canonical purine NTP pyrophosphatase [Anaerolineae bacterium]
MSRPILFATQNDYKKRLFAPLFAGRGLACLTLIDAHLDNVDIHENGHTPEENALLKARAFHGPQWPLVFGDDAGLEIDALGGEPGLQARRWNGHFPDNVDDETWLAYLLQRLEGVPLEQRTARYVAAWAILTPDGGEHVRRFYRPIHIAEAPLRPIESGAPMSAMEIPHEMTIDQVRAEIAAEWDRWGIWERLIRK